MTKTEILEKVIQGEDSITQFRRGPIGCDKLAAEFVAMSNSFGGIIVFGVDGGRVIGLDDASREVLDKEISSVANSNVRPFVYPQTEYHIICGKLVLCVTIAEGASKPYSDKDGRYWIKSGPDRRCVESREELVRLVQRLHPATVESCNRTVADTLADYSVQEVKNPSYSTRLLATMVSNPGCSMKALSELSGIPIRAIRRCMDRRLYGKFEFRGTPKQGGYYLKEQNET